MFLLSSGVQVWVGLQTIRGENDNLFDVCQSIVNLLRRGANLILVRNEGHDGMQLALALTKILRLARRPTKAQSKL